MTRLTRTLALAGLSCLAACVSEASRMTATDDEAEAETETETDATDTGDGWASSEGELPDLPSAGTETGEEGGDPPTAPLYPGDRVHSPITEHVVAAMQAVRDNNPGADDDLFMKVGDSHTVSAAALYCFAGDSVDLDVHAAALSPTLEFFLAGEAAGTTPFDRPTLAAEIGRTAGWAITGSPSPLEQELAALGFAGSGGPSLALVHYGSNDMEMGLTYASAMPGFYANMSDLLDALLGIGVVPIVVGVTPRLDSPVADRWIRSYTAVARALAQARELPFVDLGLGLGELPGEGLAGDGLHLDADPSGACLLTPAGLEHGNNLRNLFLLEALARTRAALGEGEAAEIDAPSLVGEGSSAVPFEIPALPFADTRDSWAGPGLELDVYTGCASAADESGPEHLYRLELSEPTAIRALVLDRAGVDVDLHLLDDSASEAGCLLRDDTLIEASLEAGVYHFALDTYVDGGGVEQGGEYTFVVLACDPGDPDCAG